MRVGEVDAAGELMHPRWVEHQHAPSIAIGSERDDGLAGGEQPVLFVAQPSQPPVALGGA
ncbi:MAG TPA: hypothetical protein VMH26_17700 [Burkholderiales bacterium]|nr:hypothetical protein [Burkholderiales bacterium]